MDRAERLALGGAVVALAALAVAGAMKVDAVLFNHSPSIPVGFYVHTDGPLQLGAIVTVRARDVAPDEAHARGFDEEGDRFIKRVAAVGGQHVCSDGVTLTVDGVERARRFETSASAPGGWIGCRTLADDEILLLGDSADSFDGRYWGPVSTHLITGVWRPL